jgi:hypothetical protein
VATPEDAAAAESRQLAEDVRSMRARLQAGQLPPVFEVYNTRIRKVIDECVIIYPSGKRGVSDNQWVRVYGLALSLDGTKLYGGELVRWHRTGAFSRLKTRWVCHELGEPAPA